MSNWIKNQTAEFQDGYDYGYQQGRKDTLDKVMPILLGIVEEKFPWYDKANEIDVFEKEWNKLKEQNE